MDRTRDSYTKCRNSERERQIPYAITYIWNLIYDTNETFHRKETHGLGEETYGCPGGGGRNKMDWGFKLVVANHCIWSGEAQGTISSHL